MTEAAPLYPAGPAEVPPEITRINRAYRLRVAAMIGGLFVFLLLYLVIIALTGLGAYLLLLIPVPVSGGGGGLLLILKFGGVFASGLLCQFLVKGLFKGRRVVRASHVPLRAEDHPELFNFIRRVYQDTGAPAPRRVVVSPDVNAALIYDTSLLNLIVPPRKDLLIGLGLVNVVNLTEFKAVLAHEFGHFAQRSVGFGSYLYVANQVMRDVIYSRDSLDRFVDRWAYMDLRISFPAWGLKGVLWVVRGMLSGLYRGLNLLHLSLGRQMEFNADNVAVSVTGSDAVVHGLIRLEFATECLGDAAGSLDAAADHGMFTDDLFYHQTRAAERLRKARKNDRLGLPPESSDDAAGQATIFPPANDGIPDKYRSHPTQHMRERNAMRMYVRGPRDDRSPWLLFGDAAKLKREVTHVFYQTRLNLREPCFPGPAAVIQQFIDAEHAETTFDAKYHGWYDDRFINPGDLKLLELLPWPPERIDAWLAGWPPADLADRNRVHREHQSELGLLHGLKSGELKVKGKTFQFRGRDCSVRDVPRLLAEVDRQVEEEIKAFHELDRDVFLAHWSMARQMDQSAQETWRETDVQKRYCFHTAVEAFLQGMFNEQGRLRAILGFIQNNQQMTEPDYYAVRNGLEEIHGAIRDNLRDARAFEAPTLTNVSEGASLYSLIVDRGDTETDLEYGNTMSGEWIGMLVTRFEGVLGRVKRIHFKSLGSLLACQEKLAGEWTSRTAAQEGNTTAGQGNSNPFP